MPKSSDERDSGYSDVPVRRESEEPVPRADNTAPDEHPPRDAAGNVTKPGAKPRDEGGRESQAG
jgi:hypothetical protein